MLSMVFEHFLSTHLLDCWSKTLRISKLGRLRKFHRRHLFNSFRY